MKYDPHDLERLHGELYGILAEIIRVCKVLNIPYFLQGGSAIGAFYNNGIVPWDDDIDVGMIRSDYNRFLLEAPAVLGKEYFLEWFGTEKNTPFYFAKVKKNGTVFIEHMYRNLDIHHGIFVDIFPYDRIPDSPFWEKLHRTYSRFWINCFAGKGLWLWKWCKTCEIDQPLEKSFISCLIVRIVCILLPRHTIYSLMCHALGMFNSMPFKRINIVRMPRDQFLLKDVLASSEVRFGPTMALLPDNIETYLRHHYPNLRRVLPVEEQINHAPYRLSFNTDDE